MHPRLKYFFVLAIILACLLAVLLPVHTTTIIRGGQAIQPTIIVIVCPHTQKGTHP